MAIRLSSDYVGLCVLWPVGIEQRNVLVAVAVRPAVDDDCLDIAFRVESAAGPHGWRNCVTIHTDTVHGLAQELLWAPLTP